jgi:uncharacterized GH25 family protein
MKNSISKSVWGIVALGLILTGVAIWFGTHRQKNSDTVAPLAETKSPSISSPAMAKTTAVRVTPDFASTAVIPISLSNVISDADSDWFRNNANIKALPQGTKIYGGIEFWLQGVIQLQGLATQDQHQNFRTSIVVPLDETNYTDGAMTIRERGKNIACLYLLGGTRFRAQSGEKIADILWHYDDGTVASSEIDYCVQVRDFWRSPYEDPARLPNELTKVAWQGPNPANKAVSLRLYRLALVNPHPEKTIHSLEFASAMKRPTLFVAALTLDPLMPGSRPDDLTSDEMADPELKGHLDLLVQDSDGHPLPDAKITAVTRAKGSGYLSRDFTTDPAGVARVSFLDEDLVTLDVSVEHDGFSGRKVLWDISGGETVPANYTLKLGAEVKIGGLVVNEEGNPVSGAEINVYRFWRGGEDDPNKTGEQPSFGNQNTKTDAGGRWQVGGLPASLMANIGFGIKHPDYLSAGDNIGDNSTTEKQLRDGTYKTILKRGLMVRGQVLDAAGNPVPAAKVAAGRRYFADRQEKNSDTDGKFSFHNVSEGDLQLSVMAKGFSAEFKTVSVMANMAEVIFHLKPGTVIRGHVQDESGQAVADAQVGLENNGMDSPEDAFDFSTKTDSNGDFTWDGAPNATLTFYVFHDGFEAKRDAKVSPNQDNIITLRRSRTLQGLVLDDSTEQPVTKFMVRTGKASNSDDDVYGVIRNKSFSAADGRFTMTMEEEQDNAVLVMADGYSDKVEKFPESSDKTVQVIVRMKPAASLSGIVLAPDGSPAPSVTVATSSGDGSSRHYVQLTGGRLRSYDSATKVATTDEQGRFKLGTVPDDGLLVAAGDPGFARVPLAAVKNNPTVVLQAWGRIEGVLHSGGQPVAGKDLLFNLNIPGIGTDFDGFKVTTDQQGKFTMEKIPPGDGAIVRLIQISKISWSHSDSTDVSVKPGETTQVTLGDNGALVTGRYRYSFQPTNEAPLQLEGYLTLNVNIPATPAFNSQAEAQAFFKSPEWQAAMKLQKHYTVEIKPDGTFTAENVVPGTYSLSIVAHPGGEQAWQHPPTAQGSTSITVPDSFTPTQPVDIGEVQLNPL